MNIFSVNQVTQVYVVKNIATGDTAIANPGDIKLVSDGNGNFYFSYMGASGPVRSDLVAINGNTFVTYAKFAEVAKKPAVSTITIDSTLNDGTDVYDGIYTINVGLINAIGISEDNAIYKAATVVVNTTTTIADFYAAVANELETVFKKEVEAGAISFSSSSSGVVITAGSSAASWIKGLKQVKTYELTVSSEYSVSSNADNIKPWVVEVKSRGNAIPNGKDAADLEYFHMGERGDQYRMAGYPNYIPTKYLVDESKNFDYIDIHFAYTGSNESVQKSEKDILLLAERAGTDGANALGAIAAALKTAIDALLA